MDQIAFTKIGEKLKKQRIKKGLTQIELAAKFKMKPQQVANYERGICIPPIKTWWRMSRLLFNQKDHFELLISKEFRQYVKRVLK